MIPQSLLEAIRNLDTPLDDGLTDLAGEMTAKRLGLSHTVAQQIERYEESAHRKQVVPTEEVILIFRLVGRRPDAALVFADAGRRAARYAVRQARAATRLGLRLTPKALRPRLGPRAAARIARELLRMELTLTPSRSGETVSGFGASARVAESLATLAGYPGTGCAFYSAGLAELLRVTSGFEGAMVHEQCRGHGHPSCAWRAAEAGGYG
ncbi:MAG: hypothetical protein ACT4PM_06580 [Gemmatimonadales bacterium]